MGEWIKDVLKLKKKEVGRMDGSVRLSFGKRTVVGLTSGLLGGSTSFV